MRVAACQVITKVIKAQGSLLYLLQSASEKVAPRDVPLLRELCYGTLREGIALEHICRQFLSKPIRNKDADVKAIMWLGAYQLIHLNIPAHAAINETVSVTKKIKKAWASKVVNAVLRKIADGAYNEPSAEACPSYHHKHPQWMVDAWTSTWGKDVAQEIIAANNERSPMTLRVNTNHITRQEYSKLLQEASIEHSLVDYASHAIILNTPCHVEELPHWQDGWVSVQDAAAQLSGEILAKLDVKRGLDACAAPGGKSCHWLEANPALELECIELEAHRAERIKENLARLSLNATIHVADASATDTWWSGEQYDAVLLDAPCSATGVLRRYPDIRHLRDIEQVAELHQIQSNLLQQLWETVRPGGHLLYATCSTLHHENEATVASFIAKADDANIITLNLPVGLACEYGTQLFPQRNGHDGFYYCLIQKDQ